MTSKYYTAVNNLLNIYNFSTKEKEKLKTMMTHKIDNNIKNNRYDLLNNSYNKMINDIQFMENKNQEKNKFYITSAITTLFILFIYFS